MATAPEHFAPLSEIAIRAMAEPDVPEVVAIEVASYRFPWSEGIFRDCLKVGYVCRVALQFEVVVGYGIVSTGAGEAHILNLCVRPELRCRGIGTLLLEDLMQRGPRRRSTRRIWKCGRRIRRPFASIRHLSLSTSDPGAATTRRRTAARMRPSSSWHCAAAAPATTDW